MSSVLVPTGGEIRVRFVEQRLPENAAHAPIDADEERVAGFWALPTPRPSILRARALSWATAPRRLR